MLSFAGGRIEILTSANILLDLLLSSIKNEILLQYSVRLADTSRYMIYVAQPLHTNMSQRGFFSINYSYPWKSKSELQPSVGHQLSGIFSINISQRLDDG